MAEIETIPPSATEVDRQRFETWAASQCTAQERCRFFTRSRGGEYVLTGLRMAWASWQARGYVDGEVTRFGVDDAKIEAGARALARHDGYDPDEDPNYVSAILRTDMAFPPEARLWWRYKARARACLEAAGLIAAAKEG